MSQYKQAVIIKLISLNLYMCCEWSYGSVIEALTLGPLGVGWGGGGGVRSLDICIDDLY